MGMRTLLRGLARGALSAAGPWKLKPCCRASSAETAASPSAPPSLRPWRAGAVVGARWLCNALAQGDTRLQESRGAPFAADGAALLKSTKVAFVVARAAALRNLCMRTRKKMVVLRRNMTYKAQVRALVRSAEQAERGLAEKILSFPKAGDPTKLESRRLSNERLLNQLGCPQ